MTEARIGRLVAAALHESLATHLPFRVDFYEHWLQPPRLRSGSVGMASFMAVLSFLRQEGDIYTTIVEDAGRHAAEWVFADIGMWPRLCWRWLPRSRRLRAALRLVRGMATESTPPVRGHIRWQRREGRLQLEDSPFCTVRATAASPLCGFYSAALARFCALLELQAHVVHEDCRGMGAPLCTIALLPDETSAIATVMRDSDRGLV